MTAPDPDPDTTPGLTAGGAVPVGDTPPAESSTSGVSHREDPAGRVIPVVAITAIAVLVILVLLFVVGRAVDLL